MIQTHFNDLIHESYVMVYKRGYSEHIFWIGQIFINDDNAHFKICDTLSYVLEDTTVDNVTFNPNIGYNISYKTPYEYFILEDDDILGLTSDII